MYGASLKLVLPSSQGLRFDLPQKTLQDMDYTSFKFYNDCTSFKFIELGLQDPCTGPVCSRIRQGTALPQEYVQLKLFHLIILPRWHAWESTNSSSTNHAGRVLTLRYMDGIPLKLEFDSLWQPQKGSPGHVPKRQNLPNIFDLLPQYIISRGQNGTPRFY